MEANNVIRWIGIRPRIKTFGKEGAEAKPTEVAILTVDDAGGTNITTLALETEQDELDFVQGKLPTGYRDVLPGEDITSVLPYHVIQDDPKKAVKEGRPLKLDRIPSGYTGLASGDRVGMSLGGLGDLMAYVISRTGEKRDFTIIRIPPYRLKAEREERNMEKDDDAKLLAALVKEKPELFRAVAKRDRALVNLREANRMRTFVQRDRKSCKMRIRSATMGEIFCNEEGGYPEGGIEKAYDLAVASDPVFIELEKKEARLNRQLKKCCEEIPIYNTVKEVMVGIGPSILSSIIAPVQDISLFDTVGKFKAFCGLHVLENGAFPRKRVGERCNWNPGARQAFFLLGEQFNRRAGMFWGTRLLENKVMYKNKHPYPILVEWISAKPAKFKAQELETTGTSDAPYVSQELEPAEPAKEGRMFPLIPGKFKKDKKRVMTYEIETESGTVTVRGTQRYFNGHLHKMAIWRTISEFAEWLYWKWRTMEGYPARPPKVFPPEDADAIAKAIGEASTKENQTATNEKVAA